jgi:hypothetical protein
MSYYAEYPCKECRWMKYDSFHREHYCNNPECPQDITNPYWNCFDAKKYFKPEGGE